VLVDEGPSRVNELIALGAAFDVDEEGRLELAREGGHTHPRVVHAGGAATGAEIERALVDAVRATAIAVYERWFALDFLVEQGACHGVIALDESGTRTEVRAANVLVATGGAGQLYAVTTNPAEATGDGVAMALRAGAAVADTEFIQFHPTALHHPAMPRPLLSEALRGHGAKLRDAKGEQFVDELLPRDKVSKAMTARMLEQGIDHLWLDATKLDDFNARFPTIAAALREAGLDPAKDWLPIAPAAHYFCGGIVADLDGASSLPGLWAAGETACNGVHGANRLASNSLLDGMVFAPRIVEAIERGKTRAEATGAMRAVLGAGEGIAGRRLELDLTWDEPASVTLDELQAAMTRLAGVLRSADSLDEARAIARRGRGGDDVKGYELRNLSTVAQALIASALAREESRGAHIRIDNPDTDEALRLRFVVR
jgi:L-aspartate oxidase